jgi:hypothetical protein
MMEAVRTSETSVDNHFTRQYNPEHSSEHLVKVDQRFRGTYFLRHQGDKTSVYINKNTVLFLERIICVPVYQTEVMKKDRPFNASQRVHWSLLQNPWNCQLLSMDSFMLWQPVIRHEYTQKRERRMSV